MDFAWDFLPSFDGNLLGMELGILLREDDSRGDRQSAEEFGENTLDIRGNALGKRFFKES